MIGMKGKAEFNSKKILRKAESATARYLGKAGGYVRNAARWSIRRAKRINVYDRDTGKQIFDVNGKPKNGLVPSRPGSPPRTRNGQLRRSILYAVSRMARSVVIGPRGSVVGMSGKAHEFGGRYRRETFPERPFMGPALRKTEPILPAMWADSFR